MSQSAKARPEILDLLRHPFSGWSESEEGSASSARSADTSAAMDTDAPQTHHHKQRTQQQQAVEQPPPQALGQPGFPTPFGNGSLQVRSIWMSWVAIAHKCPSRSQSQTHSQIWRFRAMLFPSKVSDNRTMVGRSL